MAKKIILFTLQTFSTTGGIQKMSRTLAHSLDAVATRNQWDFELWSVYDADRDLMPQYLPAEKFRAFGINRVKFVLKTMLNAKKPDVVILSHVNLSIIGLLIKAANPKCKVWLIAHGIEVWRPLPPLQKWLLKRCDKILCVSNFTKNQMIEWHHIDPPKGEVLNNAVDPFIQLPLTFAKPARLLERYLLAADSPVIFTLTRLASYEQYKGHDQVIKTVSKLKLKYPNIKYILAGQFDDQEEIRIQELISSAELNKQIILTGFIEEAEIADHFMLADLFVLPSKKEGFGIVFIEALAYGLPVVCGNLDGSIDAIGNGELGKAVNPHDLEELESAVDSYLVNPLTQKKRRELQQRCLELFNETDYINKLENLLKDE